MKREDRLALVAGILSVTNSGLPMPDDQQIEWLKANPYHDGGTTAVELTAHLIENNLMEECFASEGKRWHNTLRRMKDEAIAASWPHVWAKVADLWKEN